MPSNDRRRDRRNSRDPESDNDIQRRTRRPSDSHRRRRGHRATDSTGELLPKPRDRSASQYDSSPSSRRQIESTSGSGGNPLSLGGLAQLDALNAKKDRKKGWETYDEAYLQEIRAKEARLEKERKKAERGERRTDGEDEKERDTRREIERQRRKEKRKKMRQKERERENLGDDTQREEKIFRKERRRSKTQQEEVAVEEESSYEEVRNNVRLHEDWKRKQQKYERIVEPKRNVEKRERLSKSKKQRVISGPYVEDGRAEKAYRYEKKSKFSASGFDFGKYKKWMYIAIVIIILILVISIPAAVVASKKTNVTKNAPATSTSASKPPNTNLNGISPDSIPASAKGTYLDPFTWWDTMDFNVTYTDATVGGLPIMGLNSTWDDSVQANPNVPALGDQFAYGSMPIRGMNVGGWLSIEPFITPSFFSKWSSRDNVIDEWTLTSKLGGNTAATLEPHYSSFITKQTFADIRAAGFDHVRIPFSYWAVTTYDGDPYLAKTSWRYLLRGIEYARQNGLRVNLDLHGIPGSQNGWNHSGRQGLIGWLNGTDGALNAQRSLDVHNQLSQFFAQPRYKNVVTMYGLVNEPRMTALKVADVVNWTQTAVQLIRGNGLSAVAVFGDGFLGLDNWKGQLQGLDNLLLDVHQYVIFNNQQITLKHSDKLNFACSGWATQMQRSDNKNTGFGPTMCGEWSQADTDCAQYLNNVGVGSRWEGTLNSPDPSQAVTNPLCPTKNNPQCECTDANANPSSYSAAYKQWLLSFAEAQMQSFENGWGWFYWTWQTENAVQWSWNLGMAAGILPKTVQDRTFSCNSTIPDFGALGLPENY